MILSARILNDVQGVNSFEAADVGEFTAGDQASVYLQLIDASLDKSLAGFKPSGRRYIPATGAVLQVVVTSIDDATKITRLAVNPYPTDDRSIWRIDFTSADLIQGTASLQLVLTEGAVVRRGLVKNALRIASQTGCV